MSASSVVLAQMLAPLVQFPKVTASTSSMRMLAWIAAHVQKTAPLAHPSRANPKYIAKIRIQNGSLFEKAAVSVFYMTKICSLHCIFRSCVL